MRWYNAEGNPCNEINGKKTTLREARTNNLYPSVTTVIDIADKPALTNWKLNQLYDSCWALIPRQIAQGSQSPENRKKEIFALSQEKGREARDKGTLIHNAFDEYITHGEVENPVLNSLSESIKEYIEKHIGPIVATEVPFTDTEYGYGGCIDIVGEDYILDIKTKDFTADKKANRFVFDNHVMQLAAYRDGNQTPDYRLLNLFVSTNEKDFGAMQHYVWSEEQATQGWEMFKALLTYWQMSKKHGPLYDCTVKEK